MARKSKTVLTFGVKLTVPVGSNAHEIQRFLREAILAGAEVYKNSGPLGELDPESFTIALQEKKVTYG